MGSAGVTRVERPGLDLSKQPPAVRMNKELGSILTFKLKVILNLYSIIRFINNDFDYLISLVGTIRLKLVSYIFTNTILCRDLQIM